MKGWGGVEGGMAGGRGEVGSRGAAWVIRVAVQSSDVQLSDTPTLLMFDLRSQ